jgi:hypothetical protein
MPEATTLAAVARERDVRAALHSDPRTSALAEAPLTVQPGGLSNHAWVADTGWGLTILQLWNSFRDVLFGNWAFFEIEDAVEERMGHLVVAAVENIHAAAASQALGHPPAGLEEAGIPGDLDPVPRLGAQHGEQAEVEIGPAGQGVAIEDVPRLDPSIAAG